MGGEGGRGHGLPADPPHVRLLVTGMARSGTTLMQRLLSEHPQIAIAPETHFWRHAAALTNIFPVPLGAPDVRRAVEWFTALESSQLLRLDVDEVCSRIPDHPAYLWDVFSAICAATCSDAPESTEVLGEKTPDHLRWAEQALDAVEDLVVVALVRDPREILRSHREVPWGITDAAAAAEKWLDLSRRAQDCRRLHPDRFIALRYEDLVVDPGPGRQRIAGLLALDDRWDGRPSVAIDDDEWWKQGAATDVEQLPDRWPEELSDDDVATIESICGPAMSDWGYEPADRSRVPGPTTPDQSEVRRAAARIDGALLPITSEAAKKAYSERSAVAPAVTRELEQSKDTASRHLRSARTALEDRDGLRREASQLRASLVQRAEELSAATARAEQAEARVDVQAATIEEIRSGRWWRLGEALRAWRSEPRRLSHVLRAIRIGLGR